jgi:hypothetical protein
MPEIPEGAKQPQDYKAAQAEAVDPDALILFTHEGVEYIIDPAFRDDVEILEDIEEEREVKAVRRIIGDDQWDEWKEAHRGENGRVKVTDATPFIKALFEELGAGN